MLNRIIDWSARNVFIVLLGTFFIVAGGIYAVVTTPVDAIPDLSDVQVIVYTEYPGQAPQVIEDQVTYPLTTAMLGVPKSKVVRGLSVFGASFVYVIFEDGTDIYWARSQGPGVSQLRVRAPAARGDSLAWAGCDRRGLGVPVRGHGEGPHAGRITHDPGLVHSLSAHQGARGFRDRQRWRFCQAIPGNGRPAAAPGLRRAADAGDAGDPRQ